MLPPIIISLMAPFRSFFTASVWEHALALVTGMVLAPGKRTVSVALRIMGLGGARDFALYHHVLNRARWNSRAIARPLLTMILDRFLPVGPVVIGLDDTIERRWGRKIAARGIYRDPVRSSHGHFVKTSGLRWLPAMAVVPVPWAHDQLIGAPLGGRTDLPAQQELVCSTASRCNVLAIADGAS